MLILGVGAIAREVRMSSFFADQARMKTPPTRFGRVCNFLREGCVLFSEGDSCTLLSESGGFT